MTQNIQSLHDVITELDCIFNVLYENILYVFFIYNSSLLTTTLYYSVKITLVCNDTKYSVVT